MEVDGEQLACNDHEESPMSSIAPCGPHATLSYE